MKLSRRGAPVGLRRGGENSVDLSGISGAGEPGENFLEPVHGRVLGDLVRPPKVQRMIVIELPWQRCCPFDLSHKREEFTSPGENAT